MALIHCSECGADISEKASICPKCGCPISVSLDKIKADKEKKRKKHIKIISIVFFIAVVVIISVVSLLKFFNKPDTVGYYEKARWGMTLKEVQNLLGKDATLKDDKSGVLTNFEDYQGKKGIDTLVIYNCPNDSLNEVSLYISIGDDSSYISSSLIEEYTNQFDNQYGEHKDDSLIISWETNKSKIEIMNLSRDFFIITYKDITKSEE